MEQTSYKKKSALFIAIVIIAEKLIRVGSDIIMSNILAAQVTPDMSGFDYERYNMISRIISICITAFSIVFTFLMGYIFTKDKRKTVIFAGSVYFGKKAAGLLSSFISAVANSLSYTGAFSASDMSTAIFIGSFLAVPVMIVLGYFAYTAFEGINSKLEGSLDSSEMLLERAKKRFIVAYFGSAIVVSLLKSAPSLIYALINSDSLNSGTIFSIISNILSWVFSVLGFVIIYLVGYKPYKNHIDAMAFTGIAGVTAAISGLIVSVILTPCQVLLNAAIESGDYTRASILSAVTGASALISLVPEILILLYVIKFFFAPARVTLFGQEVASENESPSPAQATDCEAYKEAPCTVSVEEITQETSEQAVETEDE